MSKFTYIVAYLENSEKDLYEIFNNIKNYKNLTENDLINMNILYLVEYLDEYGNSSFSNKLTDHKICKYGKMSDLIIDYLSYVFDDDDNDDPFMNFLKDFIVIRKDNNKNTYSIIEQDKLFNCYIQIFNPYIKNDVLESFVCSNIVNFEEIFFKLINKLDELVEGEYEMLVTAGNKNNICQFSLIKENSSFHNILKKENIGQLPNPNHNQIIYECGFDEYKNFVRFNLMKNGKVSVLLSSKVPNQKMYKKYAFLLIVDEYDEASLIQFNAKDVAECFDDVDKTDIYCGIEKDDLIFGFDLI